MEREISSGFGDVLKTLRNRARLSRPVLAKRVGVHPRTLENWERGDILPDRARVSEVSRALHLSEADTLLLLEAHAGYRLLPTLHNLPTDRNPYFTGREEIFAELHRRLAPGKQVALTQAISLNGLGGVGKTQVALEYVYRYKQHYTHLLWVTADSSDMLTSELSRLARDLDLPQKEERDQSKIVQAVQRWLREYLNWLLILDNLEDLRLLSSFVPTGHLGSVLITTRRGVTEPLAQSLEIHYLPDEEGALLLLRRMKRLAPDAPFEVTSPEEREQAQTISHLLGGLPLALDQAGAYVLETGCTLSDYLLLYQQRHAPLLQRRGSVC